MCDGAEEPPRNLMVCCGTVVSTAAADGSTCDVTGMWCIDLDDNSTFVGYGRGVRWSGGRACEKLDGWNTFAEQQVVNRAIGEFMVDVYLRTDRNCERAMFCIDLASPRVTVRCRPTEADLEVFFRESPKRWRIADRDNRLETMRARREEREMRPRRAKPRKPLPNRRRNERAFEG